jgi:hypothetical protein
VNIDPGQSNGYLSSQNGGTWARTGPGHARL